MTGESALFPMVPGHEIIGKVEKVGAEVQKWRAGDIVGVGCFVDSCRRCEACQSGEEQYCEEGATFTYNAVERDGATRTYGGYSTRITVNEDYVLRIPKELPLERAAPLLCAGITTYSPLRQFGVRSGDSVAVVGLGGLGHMGVKFARAIGAHVTVLSHSPSKREDALRLGADDFVATKNRTRSKRMRGRFDFILDTVSAQHDYNSYLNLLRLETGHGSRWRTRGHAAFAVPLVLGRRRLAGSLIGGIRETQDMLDFCGDHGIGADVEVIPIKDQRSVSTYVEGRRTISVRYRSRKSRAKCKNFVIVQVIGAQTDCARILEVHYRTGGACFDRS